jgi:hypothetical protein
VNLVTTLKKKWEKDDEAKVSEDTDKLFFKFKDDVAKVSEDTDKLFFKYKFEVAFSLLILIVRSIIMYGEYVRSRNPYQLVHCQLNYSIYI